MAIFLYVKQLLHLFLNSTSGIHQDLPVNVKFLIEGMEETGSNGLDSMILAQRDTFFSNVDYIVISDCGWLSRRPALTYGTRGNCYFFAEVVEFFLDSFLSVSDSYYVVCL